VSCPKLLSITQKKLDLVLSLLQEAKEGELVEEVSVTLHWRAQLLSRRLARLSATVLPYSTLLVSSHKVFGIKPEPASVPLDERQHLYSQNHGMDGFERAISSYDDESIFAFLGAREGDAEWETGFAPLRLRYLALVAKILCSPRESNVDSHQIRSETEELILACKEYFEENEQVGKGPDKSDASASATGASASGEKPTQRRSGLRSESLRDPDLLFYIATTLLNAQVHDGPEYMDEPRDCILFAQSALSGMGKGMIPHRIGLDTPMEPLFPAVATLFSTHLIETPSFMLERALAHHCSVNHDYQGAFDRYTTIGFLYEALEILLLAGDAERAKGALLSVLSRLFESPKDMPSKDLVDVICTRLSAMEKAAPAPTAGKKVRRKLGESYLDHQRFFTALLYAELGLAEVVADTGIKEQAASKVPTDTCKSVESILLRLQALDCRNARVQRDLGEFFLHLSASDPDLLHTAFTHYRRAAQLEPSHLATKDKLGAIYMRLFQLTKDQKYLSMAYEMYRRVADSAEDNYQATANLGNVCTIQGDLRQSSSYFYAASRLAVSMDIRDTTVFTRYLYQCFAFILECEKKRKQLKEEEEAGDAREDARVVGPSVAVASSPTQPRGVPLAHKNRSTVEQFVFVSSALPRIVSSQGMGPDKMKEFLEKHLTLITSISYHLITTGAVKSAQALLPALQPWQGLMNDYAPLLDEHVTVPFADMLAGALAAGKE